MKRFCRNYAKRVLKQTIEKQEVKDQPQPQTNELIKPIQKKKKRYVEEPFLYRDLEFDMKFFEKLGNKIPIEEIVEEVKKHKPLDLLVLDMKGKIQYADYIIFCTGISSRHLRGIAKGFIKKLMVNKAPGVPKPIMEGENSEDWVCVDGGYVFLNVFSPEGRVHWDLDRKFLFEYLEDSQLSEEEMKKF